MDQKLNVDAPKSNDDCFFYFYADCAKGDNCPFRHCERARRIKMVCPDWRAGQCLRTNCRYRHMEIHNNVSEIPCFWDNHPAGCQWSNCSFLHKNKKKISLKKNAPASPSDVNTIPVSSLTTDPISTKSKVSGQEHASGTDSQSEKAATIDATPGMMPQFQPHIKEMSSSESGSSDKIKAKQPHLASLLSQSGSGNPNESCVAKSYVEVSFPKEIVQQDVAKSRNHEQLSFESSDKNKMEVKPELKIECPSLKEIAEIMKDLEDLNVRVKDYSGKGGDKQYRLLEELLTRLIIRLDDVNTKGQEHIRNARKAAILEVQSCIDKLEGKAKYESATSSPEHAIQLEQGSKIAIPFKDINRKASISDEEDDTE